jgi:hypothetical protein
VGHCFRTVALGIPPWRAPDVDSRSAARRIGQAAAPRRAGSAHGGVGGLDQAFIRRMFVDARYNVGDVLDNRVCPGATSAATRRSRRRLGQVHPLLAGEIRTRRKTHVLGAYDGVVYWEITPIAATRSTRCNRPFSTRLPPRADVAILGAGGGRQVGEALERRPRSIVAVDLVAEVFTC